jgi:hypothetical protein
VVESKVCADAPPEADPDLRGKTDESERTANARPRWRVSESDAHQEDRGIPNLGESCFMVITASEGVRWPLPQEGGTGVISFLDYTVQFLKGFKVAAKSMRWRNSEDSENNGECLRVVILALRLQSQIILVKQVPRQTAQARFDGADSPVSNCYASRTEHRVNQRFRTIRFPPQILF